MESKTSRRSFLRLAALGAATAAAAACGATPTATPVPTATKAPVPPTATKAAVAAPTATTAPAAPPTATKAPAPTAVPTAAPQAATIKIVSWVADNTDSWCNRHFKPFQDANPTVKVSHEFIAQNYIETVLTRLSGGTDIDVVTVAPDSTGTFLRAGAALDLAPNIAKDGAAMKIDQIAPWTLEDYTIKRYPDLKAPGQYGVPLVIFVWEWWFNTDIMNAAGVSVPKRGWTWDDFLTIARKCTDPAKKQYGFLLENWLLPLWPWVWMNGGTVLTADAKQLTLSNPKTVEAFSFLQKLMLEEKVCPAPEMVSAQGGGINFDSGKVAMTHRGNWNLDLSRDWKFKWDISWPPKKVAEAAMGEECGYIINAKSTKKDAAWTFIKWTLGPDGQKVSAMRDVMPNGEIMKSMGLSMLPDNVKNVVSPLSADPMVHGYPQWYRPKFTPNDLAGRLALLWTGEKKAEELLPALDKEFNAELAKPLT